MPVLVTIMSSTYTRNKSSNGKMAAKDRMINYT